MNVQKNIRFDFFQIILLKQSHVNKRLESDKSISYEDKLYHFKVLSTFIYYKMQKSRNREESEAVKKKEPTRNMSGIFYCRLNCEQLRIGVKK